MESKVIVMTAALGMILAAGIMATSFRESAFAALSATGGAGGAGGTNDGGVGGAGGAGGDQHRRNWRHQYSRRLAATTQPELAARPMAELALES